jgi:hypothetical protein
MQRRQGNVESETAAAATTFADEIKGENASIPLYRLFARLLRWRIQGQRFYGCFGYLILERKILLLYYCGMHRCLIIFIFWKF